MNNNNPQLDTSPKDKAESKTPPEKPNEILPKILDIKKLIQEATQVKKKETISKKEEIVFIPGNKYLLKITRQNRGDYCFATIVNDQGEEVKIIDQTGQLITKNVFVHVKATLFQNTVSQYK